MKWPILITASLVILLCSGCERMAIDTDATTDIPRSAGKGDKCTLSTKREPIIVDNGLTVVSGPDGTTNYQRDTNAKLLDIPDKYKDGNHDCYKDKAGEPIIVDNSMTQVHP